MDNTFLSKDYKPDTCSFIQTDFPSNQYFECGIPIFAHEANLSCAHGKSKECVLIKFVKLNKNIGYKMKKFAYIPQVWDVACCANLPTTLV